MAWLHRHDGGRSGKKDVEHEDDERPKPAGPLVFISHDTRDAALAEALSKLLSSVSAGMLKTFRSSDRKGGQGFEYGVEWYPELMRQLDSACDVVCLLTERSRGSCMKLALQRGSSISPFMAWRSGCHCPRQARALLPSSRAAMATRTRSPSLSSNWSVVSPTPSRTTTPSEGRSTSSRLVLRRSWRSRPRTPMMLSQSTMKLRPRSCSRRSR